MKEKKSINVEVGQYVKHYREQAGLTQEAFAELIGLGDKHVSAIECGSVGVSLTTLRKMSKVLFVPADLLLFGPPNNTEQSVRSSELELMFSRISYLTPQKFRIVKEILDKLLEGLAMKS